MADYKIILGLVAVVVGFVGYIPYLRDLFKGTTKPHVFSWGVWATNSVFVIMALIRRRQLQSTHP